MKYNKNRLFIYGLAGVAMLILIIIIGYVIAMPSFANTSTITNDPTGNIMGRVTTTNPAIGISAADVTIVSADDKSIVLYNTTSDENGYYQFVGVKDTLNANGTLNNAYVLRASSEYGEGYSMPFGVTPNETTTTSVIEQPHA